MRCFRIDPSVKSSPRDGADVPHLRATCQNPIKIDDRCLVQTRTGLEPEDGNEVGAVEGRSAYEKTPNQKEGVSGRLRLLTRGGLIGVRRRLVSVVAFLENERGEEVGCERSPDCQAKGSDLISRTHPKRADRAFKLRFRWTPEYGGYVKYPYGAPQRDHTAYPPSGRVRSRLRTTTLGMHAAIRHGLADG
jgi:hypothetical protein